MGLQQLLAAAAMLKRQLLASGSSWPQARHHSRPWCVDSGAKEQQRKVAARDSLAATSYNAVISGCETSALPVQACASLAAAAQVASAE